MLSVAWTRRLRPVQVSSLHVRVCVNSLGFSLGFRYPRSMCVCQLPCPRVLSKPSTLTPVRLSSLQMRVCSHARHASMYVCSHASMYVCWLESRSMCVGSSHAVCVLARVTQYVCWLVSLSHSMCVGSSHAVLSLARHTVSRLAHVTRSRDSVCQRFAVVELSLNLPLAFHRGLGV